jgi:hypothetical protein
MQITATNTLSYKRPSAQSTAQKSSASPASDDSVTFGSGDWLESPGAKALGGALVGLTPGVGCLSNFYYALANGESNGPVMSKNGPLGSALVVSSFAGLGANMIACSGALGLVGSVAALAVSSATSALSAYIHA